MEKNMEGKIKIGPVGKQQPPPRGAVNWDEGHHNGIISQIYISHGLTGIFSIQFQFVFDDKIVLSDRHGPDIGDKFDAVALDYRHEYITGISGAYRKSMSSSSPTIMSLKIVTNSNEYGPFGGSLGSSHYEEPFDFNLGKFPQFGGFYGTYDIFGLNIALDYPNEYIKGISGAYKKDLHSTPNIMSLNLVTNSNEYGPFGYMGPHYGATFDFKLGKFPQFGGFYATYDTKGLNIIGVYLQPKNIKPKTEPETSTIDAESKQIVLG